MIACNTRGRVCALAGPFPGNTTDDTALKQLWKEHEEFQTLLVSAANAAICVDAGFPTIGEDPNLRAASVTVYVPLKTKSGKQFTGAQAVSARKVTRHRGVIERVNRRFKIFKLLHDVASTTTLGNGTCYWVWRFVAIIVNRFYVPVAKSVEDID